jgi:hypothetical protein
MHCSGPQPCVVQLGHAALITQQQMKQTQNTTCPHRHPSHSAARAHRRTDRRRPRHVHIHHQDGLPGWPLPADLHPTSTLPISPPPEFGGFDFLKCSSSRQPPRAWRSTNRRLRRSARMFASPTSVYVCAYGCAHRAMKPSPRTHPRPTVCLCMVLHPLLPLLLGH